ncbi:hypothetical protein EU537_01775 [Candidatus Thorarchaeota archaeon]|nr:MAG: hypothetical protein EU537_01775 [Candidatus Thorarchaeota archaeon]
MCAECHHNLGRIPTGEEPKTCSECDSESFVTAKRIEEICPKCYSTRIVGIEEKRRALAHELRSAVMNIHYGHTKLREFNARLASAKRILVSLRMANFLGFKWFEDRIEQIQDEFIAIKNRVTNQAEIVAKKMLAETKGLIDYQAWETGQFPFVEGVTNRVSHIGRQYKSNIDDALHGLELDLGELTEHLEGLDYYRKHFAGFYEYSDLSVNELPVCAIPEIKLSGSDFLKHDKATGILYITNKRLIFIAETGMVRKKTEVVFDFPLVYLKSLEEDGRFRKRLVLKLKQGDVRVDCDEQTEQVLSDYIQIAKKFDRYVQDDMHRVRKIEATSVNVSDVRLKIEELVYSILSTNQPSKIPETKRGYYVPYQDQERQRWNPQSRYQTKQNYEDELAEELRRTLGHRNGRRRSQGYDLGLEQLRRNERELQSALSETVDLLRSGRIVPEDFIRRYRGLMRDSYSIRKELEHYNGNTEYHKW